jgi:hypothetical protein
MLKSLSTSLIARGTLAVIIAIIALAWPPVTVLALVILFAIYAFIAAGLQAARAFSSHTAGLVEFSAAFATGEPAGTRAMLIQGGLATIAFGVVLCARPGLGRGHPRPAVQPVQPDRRDLDARAGHRAAPPVRHHGPAVPEGGRPTLLVNRK